MRGMNNAQQTNDTTNATRSVLFSTTKNVAQVHAAGCKMLNRAGGMSSWRLVAGAGARLPVLATDERVTECVADLTERGFKVSQCKCLKGDKV